MFKRALLISALATSTSALASTNITWWHAMGGQLGEVVNKMASDFNASQQQCQLNVVYKGSYEETMTAAIAAYRAKQQPDIIQIFDAGAATIINAKGAVLPVADLMQVNDMAFDTADYLPGVRNFYADSAGKMIGMPFNSSTPILYYNVDALNKAGVQVPSTWEDFERIAPKLKAAGYIGFSQSHTPWIFSENFMSRHNLQLADKNNGFDGPATKIMYNNPNLIRHFNKLKAWKDAGYFGYYGTNWGDNMKPFIKGKVAMWLGTSGSFGGIKKQVGSDFKWSAAPLPYWNSITQGKHYQTFIGGAALFAFTGKSKAQNACSAKFFQFLSQPDVQLFWHKQTGYVPITTAAYDKAKAEGYYQDTPAAEVGILQLNENVGQWTKGYRLGFYPQIREIMQSQYTQFFDGKVSAEEAFKRIETLSNEQLGRFAKTVR